MTARPPFLLALSLAVVVLTALHPAVFAVAATLGLVAALLFLAAAIWFGSR